MNERYPGSMIHKSPGVPLALLRKPLNECRVTFISTSGVQPQGTLPFDTVHPVGDYTLPALRATRPAGRAAWALYGFLPLIWLPLVSALTTRSAHTSWRGRHELVELADITRVQFARGITTGVLPRYPGAVSG